MRMTQRSTIQAPVGIRWNSIRPPKSSLFTELGRLRQLAIDELQVAQLGGLPVDPERPGNIGLLASFHRLERESDESVPLSLARPEARSSDPRRNSSDKRTERRERSTRTSPRSYLTYPFAESHAADFTHERTSRDRAWFPSTWYVGDVAGASVERPHEVRHARAEELLLLREIVANSAFRVSSQTAETSLPSAALATHGDFPVTRTAPSTTGIGLRLEFVDRPSDPCRACRSRGVGSVPDALGAHCITSGPRGTDRVSAIVVDENTGESLAGGVEQHDDDAR